MKFKKTILLTTLLALTACSFPDFTNKGKSSKDDSSYEPVIVTPTKTKLNTPRDIYYRSGVLHWSEVPNADAYLIESKGIKFTITSPQFAVATFGYPLRKGATYNFMLNAISYSEEYENSDTVSSSFVVPETNEDINSLLSQSRNMAQFDDYDTVIPTGEDITDSVESGAMTETLRKAGIDISNNVDGCRAVYEKVEAKMSYDSMNDYSVNSNYSLGKVVRIETDDKLNGESFVQNTNLTLNNITIYSNELGTSQSIDDPTNYKVSEAINKMKSGIERKTLPIISSITSDKVSNTYERNYTLGIPQKAAQSGYTGTIKTDGSKTYISFVAKQIYYTVNVEDIKNPYARINESDEAILDLLNHGYCPAYISSVSYGRVVSVLMSYETASKDYESNYDFEGADFKEFASFLDTIEEETAENKCHFECFVYGGSSANEGIKTVSNIDDIIEELNASYNPSTALPISYSVSYLDGTSQTAKVGSCATYYVKKYEKIKPERIVIENVDDIKNIALGETVELKGYIMPKEATLYNLKYYFRGENGEDLDTLNGLSIISNQSGSTPWSLKATTDEDKVGARYVLHCSTDYADCEDYQIDIQMRRKYTVNFYDSLSGNDLIASIDIKNGNTIPTAWLNENIVHGTYAVNDYYMDEGCTVPFDIARKINSNYNVYVTWGDTNIITYLNAETLEVMGRASYAGSQATKLPYFNLIGTPYENGFYIEGYYIDQNLTERYTFGQTISGNITIYVKFAKILYTVTFDTQGGNEIASLINVEHGSYITKPLQDPVKEGYTFEGWYTTHECKTKFDFENQQITEDTVIYAKWNMLTFKVSFESNGGSKVSPYENVNYGSTVNEPTKPTKEGYTFEGWYTSSNLLDSEKFSFATAITSNLILYAKWKVIHYEITFMLDGGTGSTTATVDFYNKYVGTVPAVPSKANYIFVGFYTESTIGKGSLVVDSDMRIVGQQIKGNIILYAHWIKNTGGEHTVYADGNDKEYSHNDLGHNVKWKEDSPLFNTGYIQAELNELKRAGYEYLTWRTNMGILAMKQCGQWISFRKNVNGTFSGDVTVGEFDVYNEGAKEGDWVTRNFYVCVETATAAANGMQFNNSYGISGAGKNSWRRGHVKVEFTPRKTSFPHYSDGTSCRFGSKNDTFADYSW